jgi:hypothetical protein
MNDPTTMRIIAGWEMPPAAEADASMPEARTIARTTNKALSVFRHALGLRIASRRHAVGETAMERLASLRRNQVSGCAAGVRARSEGELARTGMGPYQDGRRRSTRRHRQGTPDTGLVGDERPTGAAVSGKYFFHRSFGIRIRLRRRSNDMICCSTCVGGFRHCFERAVTGGRLVSRNESESSGLDSRAPMGGRSAETFRVGSSPVWVTAKPTPDLFLQSISRDRNLRIMADSTPTRGRRAQAHHPEHRGSPFRRSRLPV